MAHPTVKAREHHGASSLDLTIPAELKEEYDIAVGDVFQIETEENDESELVLKYTRVYEQPE